VRILFAVLWLLNLLTLPTNNYWFGEGGVDKVVQPLRKPQNKKDKTQIIKTIRD